MAHLLIASLAIGTLLAVISVTWVLQTERKGLRILGGGILILMGVIVLLTLLGVTGGGTPS